MDNTALNKVGYGMYVIGSYKDGKLNAQIANTVFQITSEPPTIAVSINHNNLTHEYIMATKAFSAAMIGQDAPLSFIGGFGFKSGHDVDKLQNINYKIGETGAPIVLDHTTAYIEVKVTQSVVIGTHTIFIGNVVAAENLSEEPCMTYEYYHQVKRGTTPKSAPSYVAKN